MLGGTVVSLHGTNLSSFGLDGTAPTNKSTTVICDGPGGCCSTPCPSFILFYGLDAAGGGGFMANGHGRAQLTLVRGKTYTFALDNAPGQPPRNPPLDNPLLLSIDPVGGPAAETMLITTVSSLGPEPQRQPYPSAPFRALNLSLSPSLSLSLSPSPSPSSIPSPSSSPIPNLSRASRARSRSSAT